jgi:hypothetical protein
MTQFRLIVLSIIFAFVPWPALAASGHYSISAEQIAATVGGMGVRIAPSQITLLDGCGGQHADSCAAGSLSRAVRCQIGSWRAWSARTVKIVYRSLSASASTGNDTAQLS